MEDCAVSFWIYIGVMSIFVGGAVKKFLASHMGAMPSVVAWLGATLLLERLCALCMPAVLARLVLCVSCWLYFSWATPKSSLPVEGKAVFITGCDSGFGNATAKQLDAMGFEVFATVLNLEGEGAKHLRRVCSSRLTLLQVDITQPQQVQQALLDTKTKLGMRGEHPFPCLASYGASKAALNLLINTLRHELEPWGVKVSTILPSAFKTGQSSNTEYWEKQYKHLIQSLSPSLLEEYGEEYLLETKELFQSHAKTANEDLSPVIDTIVDALLSPEPQVRYYAGPGLTLMYFICSYFPLGISDKFLQKLFVKKTVVPRALRKQQDLSLNNNNNSINDNMNNTNNNSFTKIID
ncbi:11-beta-hydroxysteroid dehydrogenase type 2 isoform X2 [Myxocyprinus asiaticus]|uniref:11-beta-hydroxysteroid dehydrogenase type 2 isoform X2 n=1 Tax=Myxocyprinus asiaticus TaxID=70543 RepID=UPI002223E98A|nr:11-beta-hydroxysteroid dehydrogenase type 2 isoform X2 [Myxocyprinus asiaticus]